LKKSFSLDDIKTICFCIALIDFENLSGEGRDGKARELIIQAERRGHIKTLIDICAIHRPNVNWKAVGEEYEGLEGSNE
jgi:hypothetical protein